MAGAALAALATEWKASRGGRVRRAPLHSVPERAGAKEVAAGIAGPKRLVPSRAHILVAAAGVRCCVACGARADDARALGRRTCPRRGLTRGRVRVLFSAGLLDEAIRSKGPIAISYARCRGRDLEARPLEPD